MKREAHKTQKDRHAAGLEDLHVCVQCSSELVYPVEWDESDAQEWNVLLRCPNCDVYRHGTFSVRTLEALDAELDRGAHALIRDYDQLVCTNMAGEIERFVGALAADAVLPEDF
jgi:hypothetical protein